MNRRTLDDIPSTRGTRQMGVNGSTDRHPAIGGQALSECRPLRGRPRAGRVDFPSMSALARALHAVAAGGVVVPHPAASRVAA